MAVAKSVGQRRFTAPPSLSAHPFPHRQASLMMTGTSKSSTPSLRRSLRPLRRLAHLPRRSSSWRQCRRSPAFSRAARCSAAKATPTVARARPRCGSDGGAPRDAPHWAGFLPAARALGPAASPVCEARAHLCEARVRACAWECAQRIRLRIPPPRRLLRGSSGGGGSLRDFATAARSPPWCNGLA